MPSRLRHGPGASRPGPASARRSRRPASGRRPVRVRRGTSPSRPGPRARMPVPPACRRGPRRSRPGPRPARSARAVAAMLRRIAAPSSGIAQEDGRERRRRRTLPADDLVVRELGQRMAERMHLGVLVQLRLPAVGDGPHRPGAVDQRDLAASRSPSSRAGPPSTAPRPLRPPRRSPRRRARTPRTRRPSRRTGSPAPRAAGRWRRPGTSAKATPHSRASSISVPPAPTTSRSRPGGGPGGRRRASRRLARVADAHDERPRPGPVRDAEAADAGDRHGALAGDERAQQLAAHRRAAHRGDDDRAGSATRAPASAPTARPRAAGRPSRRSRRHPGRVHGRYHTGSPLLPITRFSTVPPRDKRALEEHRSATLARRPRSGTRDRRRTPRRRSRLNTADGSTRPPGASARGSRRGLSGVPMSRQEPRRSARRGRRRPAAGRLRARPTPLARRDQVQRVRLDDVGAGVDRALRGRARRRLLDERGDRPLGVGRAPRRTGSGRRRDAARSSSARRDRDGSDERGEVEVGQDVAVARARTSPRCASRAA